MNNESSKPKLAEGRFAEATAMTQESANSQESDAAQPSPQPDGFHLSPQQARLWRLLHRRPTQDAQPRFLSQCALLLDGPLDADALARSASALVERHEADDYPDVCKRCTYFVSGYNSRRSRTFDAGGNWAED